MRSTNMAKQYTYTDHKTGRVLFETVEPNFVSMEDVDKKAHKRTGRDPRLDPFVVRQIRVVPD
jgi:protocatechuate 3,4-dioxygenase beta subunit